MVGVKVVTREPDVEAEMKRFEKEIIHAMKARGWDGSEDLTKQRWIQS